MCARPLYARVHMIIVSTDQLASFSSSASVRPDSQIGLVGIVVADRVMKRLPEYPDGTRDFWCLVLTTLGFSAIMVCVCMFGKGRNDV